MADGTYDMSMAKFACLDSAPMHLIRVSTDGRIAEANSAAGAVLRRPGIKADAVGDLFVNTWVAEEDRATVRRELSETLRGVGTQSRIVKASLSLPSGSWKALLFMAATSSNGFVDGAAIVMQDFNELVMYLSSCTPSSGDSSHADLAQVRANVDEDLRAQLQQAHQQVTQLEEELKRARQQMWHLFPSPSIPQSATAKIKEHVINELRSPLSGIIGLADACHSDDTELQRPLKMISRNASRALENIIDLIDFFYLVEGPCDTLANNRRSLEMRNVHEMVIIAGEVFERCSNAMNKFGESIRKSDVEVIEDIKVKQVVFSWDHRCVSQMLYHLIINAFKFTTKGSVTLRIGEDVNAQGVNIVVQDTGIGISSENMSRIFEPFQQADNSPSRKYDGLGLGLAIVNSVVQKYCGTVKLDSKPGEGTTVDIWLPCVPENSSVTRISISTSKPDDAAGPNPTTNASNASGGGTPQQSAAPATSAAPPASAPQLCTAPDPDAYSAIEPLAAAAPRGSATVTHVAGVLQRSSGPASAVVSAVDANIVIAAGTVQPKDSGGSEARLLDLPPVLARALPQAQVPNLQQTILSVDADMQHQEVVCQALEPYGFKFISCTSGVECLQLMDRQPQPDMILLDLDMSGINGFDVLEVQRRKHSPEALPIIMVTSDRRVQSVVRGFELGANDWIHKPYETAELVARVRANLRTRDRVLKYYSKLNKVEALTGYVRAISDIMTDMTV